MNTQCPLRTVYKTMLFTGSIHLAPCLVKVLFYYFFAFFDGELHAGSGEGSGDNSRDDQIGQVPEDPRGGGYDHRDADLGRVVDHRADNAYRPEVLF